MKSKSMMEHVKDADSRRLINGEYKRGYLEGQHAAALKMAECIDSLLAEYNRIAYVPPFVEQKGKDA